MVFVVNAWREVPIFIDNMLGNDSFDGLNQVAFFARDRLCLPADLARFQTTPFRSLSRINAFIANYSATYDQSGFCWCRVSLCEKVLIRRRFALDGELGFHVLVRGDGRVYNSIDDCFQRIVLPANVRYAPSCDVVSSRRALSLLTLTSCAELVGHRRRPKHIPNVEGNRRSPKSVRMHAILLRTRLASVCCC